MQNNSISKKVCFKTKLLTNCTPFIFLATVYSKHYTNSDYALNVLQKPRSINDNGY